VTVIVVPAPVTAEIDYLLGRRFGRAARAAFVRDLAAGRFTVACLEREDYATIGDLDARYADLGLGLADCALVVLANRYGTDRIVSFDERHFRAVTPLAGGVFTILPADCR
jgi:predicted nucleic acid-binding protein